MKNERGYRMKPENLRRWTIDIYFAFLIDIIDNVISYIHIVRFMSPELQPMAVQYTDTDGNDVTSILHCYWLKFVWHNIQTIRTKCQCSLSMIKYLNNEQFLYSCLIDVFLLWCKVLEKKTSAWFRLNWRSLVYVW